MYDVCVFYFLFSIFRLLLDATTSLALVDVSPFICVLLHAVNGVVLMYHDTRYMVPTNVVLYYFNNTINNTI